MENRYLWAAVSIAVMWLATILVGVFGPLLEIRDAAGGVLTIPALAAVVALFALIGTVSVGLRGFRQ